MADISSDHERMNDYQKHCIPIQNLQLSDEAFSCFSLLDIGNNEPVEIYESFLSDIFLHRISLFHQYNFESLVDIDANIKLVNPISNDLTFILHHGSVSVLVEDFGISKGNFRADQNILKSPSRFHCPSFEDCFPLFHLDNSNARDLFNRIIFLTNSKPFLDKFFNNPGNSCFSTRGYSPPNPKSCLTGINVEEFNFEQILSLEHELQDQLISIKQANTTLDEIDGSLSHKLNLLKDAKKNCSSKFTILSNEMGTVLRRKDAIIRSTVCCDTGLQKSNQELGIPIFSKTIPEPDSEFDDQIPILLSAPAKQKSLAIPSYEIQDMRNSLDFEISKKSYFVGNFTNISHSNKSVLCLKVSGHSLFVASADWHCYRYDTITGSHLSTYLGHKNPITCIEIFIPTSQSRHVYTGSSDRTVRCYDMFTTKCLCIFTFEAQVMCISINYETLFVGLSSGVMACINLTNNTLLCRLPHHKPKAISYIYSTDSYIFTGSFDSSIVIFKLQSVINESKCCTFLKKYILHKGPILCLYFQNNIIYSASVDQTVIAYDIIKSRKVRQYMGHALPVSSIQVLLTVILTACLDKKIRIFHAESAQLLLTYIGYSHQIFSMVVKNKILYTGSKDGIVFSSKLDLTSYFQCCWSECDLRFSSKQQIQQHLLEEHIESLDDNLTICGWGFCQEFLTLLSPQAKSCHILSHTDNLRSTNHLPIKLIN